MTTRETLGPSAAFAANIVTDTPASAGEREAVAKQWRAVDEQGPRTAWRELDWRSEREVKQWEASHAVEYRDLYAQPHPSQQAGTEGAYTVAEAERDHWLKEAMRHKRPGRRSLHEQSDLDRARIAQRIMDKIAALNPSEVKG